MDYTFSGIQSSDGNYLITGEKYDSAGNSRLFAAKLNETGDTIWTKTFTEENSEYTIGKSIIETNDGGYAIVGRAMHYDYGDKLSMILIKLDKDGNLTFVDDYEGNNIPDKFYLA